MVGAERDALDPRGLIRESFRMEGLGPEACRAIFFDWALGLADDADSADLIRQLLDRYADEPAEHPMLAVLREGLERTAEASGRRRGGRRRTNGDAKL